MSRRFGNFPGGDDRQEGQCREQHHRGAQRAEPRVFVELDRGVDLRGRGGGGGKYVVESRVRNEVDLVHLDPVGDSVTVDAVQGWIYGLCPVARALERMGGRRMISKRRVVCALALIASLVAASCQSAARSGTRCRTSDFGDDGTFVMRCVNGRWQRLATKAQVAQLIAGLLAGRTRQPSPSILRVDDGAGPADPLSATATWLETVNSYRLGSGLSAITDEPAWSVGIVKHLVYLRDTPSALRTGQYANAHTENPASTSYTPEGAAAGGSSNLGGGQNERAAIENWMTAPFHAIGMLRPSLQRSAFGILGTSAGLDVIRGLATVASPTVPIVFPGDGAITRLRSFGGEFPNPLESCPGYSSAGLPMIVLLPADPPTTGVRASMITPDGTTLGAADICVVDEDTFVSSDAIYGPTGRSILDSSNAVLIIPRRPLTAGRHAVVLTVPGRADVSWSFQVARQ